MAENVKKRIRAFYESVGRGFESLPSHSKCTVRTLGSNVTIQMVGSVFVLYCEIPTRQ
nr:MAG TPA: hypothetical protein [Caudoviricetes sp.]